MKFLKNMGIMLLVVIMLIISSVLYLYLQRDTKTWTEEIEVSKDLKIPVEFMSSQRKYFGGHGLGFGGGHNKNHVKFKYKETSYYSENSYTPVVINYYKGDFYIVYFDRETDFNKITFKFFKSSEKGELKEISDKSYPKHLTIQNRWFDKEEEEKNTKLLELSRIRGSLTAKIWYQLETGVNYYESPSYIPLQFLKDYKEKYIINIKEKTNSLK